jgi:phage anti-repressor protein
VFEIAIVEETLNHELVKTVNARELHAGLGVGNHFRTWIKRRIEKYDFIQDVDFITVKTDAQNGAVEYFITLDMAKELSMVERTDKGKEARQYFIKMEKQALSKPMSQLEMLSEGFKQMALVEKKQIALETRQDKQGTLLLDLSAKTVELDNKIATAKSREVIPTKGYCSVKSLEITFANVFPKTHIRGLLSSSFALPLVKTKTATRWVEGTSEWSDYIVYNIANVGLVINAVVSSGIRVSGSKGKPTKKVKSPLYGQPFKHPMECK